MGAQIIATERILFGVLDLFLNGHRQVIDTSGYRTGSVRKMTNLGYLTANASLAYAESIDDFVVISLKNGSGIRSSISQTVVSAGVTETECTPNKENLDGNGNVVEPEGGISEKDIKNVLAFNTSPPLVKLRESDIADLFEHGVSGLPQPLETPRAVFVQISSLAFFCDGGTTIAGSDTDLLVLHGDSFAGVTDIRTSTRLALVAAARTAWRPGFSRPRSSDP